MGYSFRFYGRAPADWREGAALGHAYEVQFARPLDDAQRVRLAELYERTLRSGAAEPSPAPWLWSDARFAMFHVGERFVCSAPMLFARVTDFLMEARAICPIRDVVYLNAAEPGNARWDLWTVQTQPLPDAGPRYPMALDSSVILYPRDRSGDLPVAAPDDEFEAARKAARASHVRQSAAQAGAAGGLALEPDTRPEPTQWPEAVRSKFELHDPRDLLRVGPRPCAYTRNERGEVTGFVFLDDEGERSPVTLPVPQNPQMAFAVHPDGTRGLCCVYNTVYEIDFATGEATERWQAPGEKQGIQGLGYLAGGELWAVKSYAMLYVVNPTGDEPTPIVTTKSKGTCLHIGRQGTILFTSEWGKKPQVFGFSHNKLKKLSTFKLRLHFQETDGVIYLFCGDDTFRLDNVDATYESFAGKQRKKAEKARLAALGLEPARNTKGRSAKKAKPALAIRWGAEFPPDVLRAHERVEITANHEASGASAVYTCMQHPGDPRFGYDHIRWTDAACDEVAIEFGAGRHLCFAPGGGSLVVATHGALYRIERSGDSKVILPAGKSEFFRQVRLMGDRLLTLTNKRLYLVDANSQGDAAIVHKLGATHGFQVLLVPGYDAATVTRDNKGLDVVSIVGDKLKKLGKVDDSLREVAWKDSALYVWDQMGARAGVVDNIMELLEA